MLLFNFSIVFIVSHGKDFLTGRPGIMECNMCFDFFAAHVVSVDSSWHRDDGWCYRKSSHLVDGQKMEKSHV